MKRTALLGATLACVALTTIGCSAASEPESSPLASYPRPDYGMDALLVGTVRVLDRCLVVESGADVTAVPVFPSGDATWDDETHALTWRGESFHDGDSISLGGGFVDPDGVDGTYFPAACEGGEAFLVAPH